MRILLVMMLGFVLVACGENNNHIEVHGIMIGAPIEEVKDLGGYEKHDRCEITIYYKRPFEKYSEVAIFELDGNVAAVSVRESGKDKVQDYIEFMTKNYGNPNITSNSGNEENYKFNSKGILFKIEADRFFSGLTAVYSTEKIDRIADDVFKMCEN